MIFNGKSTKSFSEEMIYPFLNTLLQSNDDGEVKESLKNINVLIDIGIDGKPFLELQKTLYHHNSKIAHNSLNILRKMSSSARKDVEIKNDVWKGMYPFFCDRASSSKHIAIDSLKIIEGLIDFNIIDDTSEIQKILYHDNETVAHLALDVLRKEKSPVFEENEPDQGYLDKEPEEVGIEEVSPQKEEGLDNRIKQVLNKNPKYAQMLNDVLSKHKTE